VKCTELSAERIQVLKKQIRADFGAITASPAPLRMLRSTCRTGRDPHADAELAATAAQAKLVVRPSRM
jgi:hypothetical protein